MVVAQEKGKAGLSNRAVMPISYEGEHIGSVEFGLPIDDTILKSIKNQIGSHISIVVPDGDGFRYQAKTNSLTIPERNFPFLRKMLHTDKVVTKRVMKNGKNLVTTLWPYKRLFRCCCGVTGCSSGYYCGNVQCQEHVGQEYCHCRNYSGTVSCRDAFLFPEDGESSREQFKGNFGKSLQWRFDPTK
jgi:hypothetical protein